MLFAIRAEGRSAGAEGDFPAIVIIAGRSLKDMVGLRIAMVLVDTNRAEWRYDDFGIHIAFAIELGRSQEFYDRDGSLAVSLVCGLKGIRFNKCLNKMLLLFFSRFICYSNIIQLIGFKINAGIPSG